MSSFAAYVVAAVAAAAVSSGTPAQSGLRANNNGPVDAGTVQSVYVYEIDGARVCNGTGTATLDKDGRVCGALRRFELKGIDRTRALGLVNDNLKAAPRGCAQKTRHAFVFETTKGVRAVDVNFACHAIGGRALSNKAEKELAGFMRLYGLVNGLGGL